MRSASSDDLAYPIAGLRTATTPSDEAFKSDVKHSRSHVVEMICEASHAGEAAAAGLSEVHERGGCLRVHEARREHLAVIPARGDSCERATASQML